MITREQWVELYYGSDLAEMSEAQIDDTDWGNCWPLVDRSDRVVGVVDSDGPHEFRTLDLYKRPDGSRYLVLQDEVAVSEPTDDADTLVASGIAAQLI